MDSGCGMLKEDQIVFAKTLTNLAGNPNVAAVLCVGLGCEAFKPDQARAAIERFGKPVKSITMHNAGGYAATVENGVTLVRELLAAASKLRREPVDVSDLVLGLNCGASDPASGLTANQALGAAVDLLVDAGGRALIGETTECVGAEEEMAANAATPELARRVIDTAALARGNGHPHALRRKFFGLCLAQRERPDRRRTGHRRRSLQQAAPGDLGKHIRHRGNPPEHGSSAGEFSTRPTNCQH